jgi:hypothetical protein
VNVNLKRRDLLRSAPFAVPALKANPTQASAAQNPAEESIAGMNVILETDPDERVNLAVAGSTLTAEQSAARERLTAKLREVEATRLQPLPG